MAMDNENKKVFTAPMAYITIDSKPAGMVRNLTFTEQIQRANVQGLGQLAYKEVPAVVYTCQWSVSQYFISFKTPVMRALLKKYGTPQSILDALVLGDLSFSIVVYRKTSEKGKTRGELVDDVVSTGETIANLQDCHITQQQFQLQETGIAGVDVQGVYLKPVGDLV